MAIAAMWPHTRWAALAGEEPAGLLRAGCAASRAAVVGERVATGARGLARLHIQVARMPVPVIGSGWAHALTRSTGRSRCSTRSRRNEPKPGEPNHIFNDYVDGGFIIYHAPGYKVFVDDRCEVFGGPWLVGFRQGRVRPDTATARSRSGKPA